jgi:hypothetical protein
MALKKRKRVTRVETSRKLYPDLTLNNGVDMVVAGKRTEGVRDRTLRDYVKMWGYFTEWLLQHYEVEYMHELTPEMFRNYINYMQYDKRRYDGHKYIKGIPRNSFSGIVGIYYKIKGVFRMSYRYDMQGKSRQQQAIVRQRDEADRKAKIAYEKKKQENKSHLSWEPAPRLAQYQGIFIKKSEKYLFEIRVTDTAKVNGPCGLKDTDINEWLFKIAESFAEEVKEYKIFTITSSDVRERELTVNWKSLKCARKDDEN